jgi:hypothetical protein
LGEIVKFKCLNFSFLLCVGCLICMIIPQFCTFYDTLIIKHHNLHVFKLPKVYSSINTIGNSTTA